MSRFARLAVVALALALTGCSTTVPGVPVPAAGAGIDTGNFPTTPRTVKAVNAADAWQQEGWNLGEYVVAPWDVDPAFTYTPDKDVGIGAVVISPLQLLDSMLTIEQKMQLFDAGLQTGFRTSAADSSDGTFTVGTGVLKFSQPATAATAIRTMTATPAPAVPAALRGTTGTVVLNTVTTGGRTSTYTATAQGSLVVLASVTGAPTPQRAVDLLAKAIPAQLAKAAGYHEVPYIGGIPTVDMDKYGIMKRTILGTPDPRNKDIAERLGLSADVRVFDGYRSARSQALFVGNKRTADEFAREGLEWMGATGDGASTVSIATDPGKARAMREERGKDTSCAPGLPADAVSCDKTADGTMLRCTLSYERWVAIAMSTTKPLLAQKCAAQYLILKAAGP